MDRGCTRVVCVASGRHAVPWDLRIHRGEVLGTRGAWEEAESEIRAAGDELAAFKAHSAAEAFHALADIQRRRGDLAGAEHSFRRAHELGRNPHPGLGLVRLAQGQPDVAVAALRSALADRSTNSMRRAELLAAEVEAALATGELALARTAAEDLSALAEEFDPPAVNAMAALARGAVRLADDDAAGALPELR